MAALRYFMPETWMILDFFGGKEDMPMGGPLTFFPRLPIAKVPASPPARLYTNTYR
jgi:hypothetical protein